MDLLNKDLNIITKDLQRTAVFAFRQDAKLAEAIDKLFFRNNLKKLDTKEIAIVLPGRQLQFYEVQDLMNLSLNGNSLFCFWYT